MGTDAGAQATEASSSQRNVRRQELVAFYQKHEPAKVELVDGLLAHPFEDLFNALMDKYGEVPDAWLASAAEQQHDAPASAETGCADTSANTI